MTSPSRFKLIECPNCGKQIESDFSPGEKCYWCGNVIRPLNTVKETSREVTEMSENVSKTAENSPADPIPPKPDTTGLNPRQRNSLIHDYYEENKERILAEFNLLPPEEQELATNSMTKRWEIGSSAWSVIRARWMPQRFTMPEWKTKSRAKPTAPKKAPSPADKKPAAEKPPAQPREKGLPALPTWNEEWTSTVKIAWFETLVELTRLETEKTKDK